MNTLTNNSQSDTQSDAPSDTQSDAPSDAPSDVPSDDSSSDEDAPSEPPSDSTSNDAPGDSPSEEDSPSDKIEEIDDFKCVVCRDILIDPVTLACQHTFCRLCIDPSMHETSTLNLNCFICRTPYKILPGNTNNLIESIIIKLYPKLYAKRLIEIKDQVKEYDIRKKITQQVRREYEQNNSSENVSNDMQHFIHQLPQALGRNMVPINDIYDINDLQNMLSIRRSPALIDRFDRFMWGTTRVPASMKLITILMIIFSLSYVTNYIIDIVS